MKTKVLLATAYAGLILAAGGVRLAQQKAANASNEYRNPVFQPTFADPSVIRGNDGYFYAYATEDDWGDGHGNHFVPIIRSKDLVHWKYIRDAFQSPPSWHGGGIWAPNVIYMNGKYYLYYAMSVWGDTNPGIGVATASSPAGPFVDHGKLFTSAEIGVSNSIDPYVFVDGGTPYLFWGSFHGIYCIQLTRDGFHTVGRKFQIAGSAFEATDILKHGGYYYFFGSQGSCCDGADSTYYVSVGRSKSLRGPYLNQNGENLLYSDGSPVIMGQTSLENKSDPFVGPGSIDIILDSNGTDWMLYHAIDSKNPYLPNGATRRPLMIDPLQWKNGWPFVKGYVPSTKLETGPVVK